MSKTNLSLQKTSDGSMTLLDMDYDEAMHSTSGAFQEALLKHVLPSQLLTKTKKPMKVLDVGFGLGYNILALLRELKKVNYTLPLIIHSLEINRNYSDFIDHIIFHDERDQLYSIIRTAYANCYYESKNISIKIHFGDGRSYIGNNVPCMYDAVFHDPYSPSKNPELWTVQFFSKLHCMMSPDAVMTTYSSAPQVRGALLSSGFIIGRGPSVGKKRRGTIASKSNIISRFTDSEINDIMNNYRSTPYNDLTFHDTRKGILERRLDEMKIKRQSISSSSCKTDLSD